jgi:hypothetical protein
VRIGILLMLAGIITLLTGITLESGPSVVTVPLLLIGLGIGALASQLGAVTVSAVPTHQRGEVGGLQNTANNVGASLGTVLAGSILLSILAASLIAGIRDNPQIPASVQSQASVQLAAGVPFLSDSQAQAALDKAGVPQDVTAQVLAANQAGTHRRPGRGARGPRPRRGPVLAVHRAHPGVAADRRRGRRPRTRPGLTRQRCRCREGATPGGGSW